VRAASKFDSSALITRWRYAIAMYVQLIQDNEASHFIMQIVRQDPVNAVRLLRERRFIDLSEPHLIDPQSLGSSIRDALAGWITSFSWIPGSDVSISQSGIVTSILVRVDGRGYATIAWYSGKVAIPEVVTELPEGTNPYRDWPYQVTLKVDPGPTWPFIFTRDYVIDLIDAAIESRSLPGADESITLESRWNDARVLLGRGIYADRAIELEELDVVLKALPPGLMRVYADARERMVDLDKLRGETEHLRTRGGVSLTPPFIAGDIKLTEGLIWNHYSRQALLDRTRTVYRAAMQSYVAVVEAAFPTIKHHLRKFILMPARIVGRIQWKESREPVLDYYWLPLEQGGSNEVEIQYGDPFEPKDALLNVEAEIRRTRRSETPPPYALHATSVLQIYGSQPVTDMTYRWIQSDLHALDWSRSSRIT
jgi:hypothetical protein